MKTVKKIYESKKIDGLVKFDLDTFNDFRGDIWTIYSKEYTDFTFVADKVSISRFGVLRGFHGDPNTAKLVTCISGQFQFAVVDLRKSSKTFENCEHFLINDGAPSIIIVPAGCINAHLSLSERCVFFYKWSQEYRGPNDQVTVAWNDSKISVPWMITRPILSERDLHAKQMCDVKPFD